MAIWPIFQIFERETQYVGGGKLWVPWWRQASAENQLKVTVEDISVAARVWWRWESGRHSKIKGGSEGGGHIHQRVVPSKRILLVWDRDR